MSISENTVATLLLNKPVSGTEEHWIVSLEEETQEEGESVVSSEIPMYEGSILRIGRGSSNDIVIRSKLSSRFHALLSVTRNGVIVCDLDSLNGSFVNGYRIDSPQDVSNGDTLRIGPVEFNVSMRLARRSLDDDTVRTNSEIKQVEIVLLLADLCGYQEKLTASSPEALTPILRNWFSDARDSISSNGGAIDRFLGDAILAYWIVDSEQKEDVVRQGLLAADQLQKKTNQLKRLGKEASPWSCNITVVTNKALLAKPQDDASASLILGSVLNELFAINTFAKRSQIPLSCNLEVGTAIKSFAEVRALPEVHTAAVVGEVVQPLEITKITFK